LSHGEDLLLLGERQVAGTGVLGRGETGDLNGAIPQDDTLECFSELIDSVGHDVGLVWFRES